MLITNPSQLKLGQTYYISDYRNPNLKHQEDGIGIFYFVYEDISEDYKSRFGIYPEEKLMLTKKGSIFFIGNQYEHSDTYYGMGWIKHHSFFTTIEEAYHTAIFQVFNRYQPYHE